MKAHRNRLPTEYLADLGFLNDRLICAHCRCMEPREEKLLGDAGVTVAFNAAHRGAARLEPAHRRRSRRQGCTIAMGTDNMAEDMVEVMRTGLFMERVRREDGRNPTPEQALRWATRNGYRAIGDAGRRLAGAGQQGRPDHDRHRSAPTWCRCCASSPTFVHQGQARDVEVGDGRRPMADARRQGADHGRAARSSPRRRGSRTRPGRASSAPGWTSRCRTASRLTHCPCNVSLDRGRPARS